MVAAKHPASFESALQELEAIVRKMESGDLALEDSLAQYERGMALLKHCQEALESAERKIRVLEGGTLGELTTTTS